MGSTLSIRLGREAEFWERDVGAKHLVYGVLATRIWVRISLLPISISLEGRARRTGQWDHLTTWGQEGESARGTHTLTGEMENKPKKRGSELPEGWRPMGKRWGLEPVARNVGRVSVKCYWVRKPSNPRKQLQGPHRAGQENTEVRKGSDCRPEAELRETGLWGHSGRAGPKGRPLLFISMWEIWVIVNARKGKLR